MISRNPAKLLREGTYFLGALGLVSAAGSFIYLAGISMGIFWSHLASALVGAVISFWLFKRDFVHWIVDEVFDQIDPQPADPLPEDTLIRFMRSPFLEKIPSTCSVKIIDGTDKESFTAIGFTKAVEEGFREWARLQFEYSVDVKICDRSKVQA